MTTLVAGATGFLGSALCARLKMEGHEVVALSRTARQAEYADRVEIWNGRTLDAWVEALEGADVLFNLCGCSVARRWTAENKREIVASRVGPTALLAEACSRVAAPPPVWINASGIGFYPANSETALGEDSPPGATFMGEVVRRWEAAFFEPKLPGRRVALRTGVVLGHGGAYAVFERLVQRFLGAAAGSGRQWMSWIHVHDWVEMALWALKSDVEGPLNAVAPNPIRNAEFMRAMRRAYRRPWCPPAPAWAVRLGCALFGPDPSLALDGYRIVPRRALSGGFAFRYPSLDEALMELAASR